jgi:hypothetical protein
MKLLITKFSPLPCFLVPLRPKYSPQRERLLVTTMCVRMIPNGTKLSDGSFAVLCAVFLNASDYKRRSLEKKRELVPRRTSHDIASRHCRVHSSLPSNIN